MSKLEGRGERRSECGGAEGIGAMGLLGMVATLEYE